MAPKNPVVDKHNAEFQVAKKLSYSPIESEEEENGLDEYSCSSPSDSGFIICPIPKTKSKSKSNDNKSKVKLFSEEDEITLLTEFAQFRSEHGPASDWVKFHSLVKDKLSNEFSKTQLSEKIRNFKKKFDNCSAKGDGVQFLNPHNASLFRISKTVWGNEVEGGPVKRKLVVEPENLQLAPPLKKHKPIPSSPPSPPSSPILKEPEQQSSKITKEEFNSLFPLLIESFNYETAPCFAGREYCYLIGREKGQELEDQFRELEARKHRLQVKRYNLTLKQLEKRNS